MIDVEKLLKNGRYIDEAGQLWVRFHYGNDRVEWHIENVKIKHTSILPPGIPDEEFKKIIDERLNSDLKV